MLPYEVSADVPGRFAELIAAELARGAFCALSGGSTFKVLAASLSNHLDAVAANGSIGQVDERFVPVASSNSNFETLRTSLAGLPVHLEPMIQSSAPSDERLLEEAEQEPYSPGAALLTFAEAQARRYDLLIRSQDKLGLVHLGVGTDGHTASLFPGSPALEAENGLVTLNQDPNRHNPFLRITLTLEAISFFPKRVIVAVGSTKATIVREVLYGSGLPIHRVPERATLLLIDEDAAALL